jgi:hypothetical protein
MLKEIAVLLSYRNFLGLFYVGILLLPHTFSVYGFVVFFNFFGSMCSSLIYFYFCWSHSALLGGRRLGA